jgi:cytidylate kinase
MHHHRSTPARPILITIDGPAGAGKTTVSKLLAQRLGYRYIDTGALYRGVALAAERAAVDPEDENDLGVLCTQIRLDFESEGPHGALCLVLDGEDVTREIRQPHITMLASAVSAKPQVRQFLLDLQRKMGASKRAVFEGRDMGTVVFPQADLKFYLEADPAVRARRRFAELPQDAGQTLTAVEADMAKRDHDDTTRSLAPLKPAEDAVRIDATHKTVQEVVQAMLVEVGKIV